MIFWLNVLIIAVMHQEKLIYQNLVLGLDYATGIAQIATGLVAIFKTESVKK